MNSQDFLKNSVICAWRSGERLGVGSLSSHSASLMKIRADLPVSTGDEQIAIAISDYAFEREAKTLRRIKQGYGR